MVQGSAGSHSSSQAGPAPAAGAAGTKCIEAWIHRLRRQSARRALQPMISTVTAVCGLQAAVARAGNLFLTCDYVLVFLIEATMHWTLQGSGVVPMQQSASRAAG